MSGEVVTFVSRRKLGSPSRKAVLVQFAETANEHGKGIWKSHKTIAALTELSVRSVQRIIKEFVTEGLVEHVGYHTKNGVTTKAYNMNLKAISKLDLVRSDTGFTAIDYDEKEPESESGQNGRSATVSQNDDTDDTKHVAGVTLTVPTVLTVPSVDAGARDAVGIVFANWNRMAEANGLSQVRTNVYNAGRAKVILKRLEDCKGDIEPLLQAIRNVPNNPHWLGKSEGGWRADFDWVFSPKNFSKVFEYTKPAQTPKARNDRTNQNSDRYRKSDELDAATRIALADMGYSEDGEPHSDEARLSECGVDFLG